MRLSEFIRSEMETILKEWEAFATTLQPTSENMSALALRDHAPQILRAVALELSAPQTTREQAEKSKGRNRWTKVHEGWRRLLIHRTTP